MTPVTRREARLTIDAELVRVFGPTADWSKELTWRVSQLEHVTKTEVLQAVAWLLAQTTKREATP